MGLYLGLVQDNYPGRRPQAPACFNMHLFLPLHILYCIYILPSLPHKNHPTDLEIEPMKHSEAGVSASNAPMPWYCTSALPSYWVTQAFIGNLLRPTTNVVFLIIVSPLMFHLLKFKDLSLYMHPLQATHPTKKETSSDPTKPHFSTPRGCSQSPINVASIDLAFHLDINASEEKRQETTVQAPFVSTQFLDDFFFGGGTHSGKLLISPHLPDMSKPYDHCLHQRLSLPTRTPA